MARKRNEDTATDTYNEGEAQVTHFDENAAQPTGYTDPDAAQAAFEDPADDPDAAVPITEDEFAEVVWPGKRGNLAGPDICVYVNKARWVAAKEGSKSFGDPASMVLEFVVADSQVVEGLDAYAGQTADFWFRRKKGQNQNWKRLLLATFPGALPVGQAIKPSDFLKQSYIITIRHYQADDRDQPGQKITRMDIESIRPDRG